MRCPNGLANQLAFYTIFRHYKLALCTKLALKVIIKFKKPNQFHISLYMLCVRTFIKFTLNKHQQFVCIKFLHKIGVHTHLRECHQIFLPKVDLSLGTNFAMQVQIRQQNLVLALTLTSINCTQVQQEQIYHPKSNLILL